MSRILGWRAAAPAVVIGSMLRISAAVEAPPAVDNAKVITAVVRPSRLRVEVHAKGVVRHVGRRTFTAPGPGPLKVLWIQREGVKVAKGDPVCRLDAKDLEETLIKQQYATRAADGAFQQAKLKREIAEIGVEEYEKGIYPQDKSAALGEIKSAENALAEAEAELTRMTQERDRIRTALDKEGDKDSPLRLLAELAIEDRVKLPELRKQLAQLTLEAAKSKLDVLEHYTHPVTVKRRQADVEQARSDEGAREQDHKFSKQKETWYQSDVADRVLRSRFDGVVLDAEGEAIVAGSFVEPGRALVHVQPFDGRIGVAISLPEAQVELFRPGMPVRVALPCPEGEASVAGVVASVASKPDPHAEARQAFAVEVQVVDVPSSTSPRPGSGASVHAVVETPEDVLCIPTKTLVWFDGIYRVGVKPADGPIDWREVSLGLSDGPSVEVVSGLKAGEAVVIDPVPLLSDDQRRKFSIEPPPVAPSREFQTPESNLHQRLAALTPDERKALKEAAENGRPDVLSGDLRRKLSPEPPTPPKRRTALIASLVHKLAASTPTERDTLKGGVCPESIRVRLGLTPLEVGLVQEFAKETTPKP